jgi:hypothetical protein
MAKKRYTLTARVSTENPKAICTALEEFLPKASIISTEEGFLLKATMQGESAKELNRTLISTLRRVERKTRLRAEWTSDNTTERFFDYVLKGLRKS